MFDRVAPAYRRLQLENGELRVTDEHPLWVQGKGWTEAREVREDDVIAAEQGDVLVLANVAVDEPLQVHNFSVASTASYFAGTATVGAQRQMRAAQPLPRAAQPKQVCDWSVGRRAWRMERRIQSPMTRIIDTRNRSQARE